MYNSEEVSLWNTYSYGDAPYWDARYIQEASIGSFDWYQRYPALRPFVRKYIPPSSRILMVGSGNSVMSEDMVKDGYEDIMNVDISSVATNLMRRKYEHVPQLKYMQMDVRDMSFFPDESFDSVIDKGTLDSLMCGTDAPISSAQMLGEASRLIKPGGVYMLITYGDPTVRMPHLSRPVYNWKIELYIIRSTLVSVSSRVHTLSNVASFTFIKRDPDFKGQRVRLHQQNHALNLLLPLRWAYFLRAMYWKIQILTLFMSVKRWIKISNLTNGEYLSIDSSLSFTVNSHSDHCMIISAAWTI